MRTLSGKIARLGFIFLFVLGSQISFAEDQENPFENQFNFSPSTIKKLRNGKLSANGEQIVGVYIVPGDAFFRVLPLEQDPVTGFATPDPNAIQIFSSSSGGEYEPPFGPPFISVDGAIHSGKVAKPGGGN